MEPPDKLCLIHQGQGRWLWVVAYYVSFSISAFPRRVTLQSTLQGELLHWNQNPYFGALYLLSLMPERINSNQVKIIVSDKLDKFSRNQL